MKAKPFFIVQLNIDPAHEERWHEWYHSVHIPEVMEAGKGILHAARFRKIGGTGEYNYSAVYEFESEESLREFLASSRLAEMSAQYNKDWGKVSYRINTGYVPFFERFRENEPTKK